MLKVFSIQLSHCSLNSFHKTVQKRGKSHTMLYLSYIFILSLVLSQIAQSEGKQKPAEKIKSNVPNVKQKKFQTPDFTYMEKYLDDTASLSFELPFIKQEEELPFENRAFCLNMSVPQYISIGPNELSGNISSATFQIQIDIDIADVLPYKIQNLKSIASSRGKQFLEMSVESYNAKSGFINTIQNNKNVKTQHIEIITLFLYTDMPYAIIFCFKNVLHDYSWSSTNTNKDITITTKTTPLFPSLYKIVNINNTNTKNIVRVKHSTYEKNILHEFLVDTTLTWSTFKSKDYLKLEFDSRDFNESSNSLLLIGFLTYVFLLLVTNLIIVPWTLKRKFERLQKYF